MPGGLYTPMPRSPVAYLSDGINDVVTTVPVDDMSKLPNAPNIATIGDGANSETIKYTGMSGGNLTGVVRGFEGEARSWNKGIPIANVPCAQHIRALQEKVAYLVGTFINSAGSHNSIYRGKNLGTSVTTEQYAAISAGTFDDLFIGDYWTINSVKYLIAAFNYYYNAGDTALTQNHVTLVPAMHMYTHVMNDANTTEGGYISSKMYTSGLDSAISTIKADFSGHVVKHRKYLCSAVADGQASAGAWVDSEVDLMNEVMAYGSVVNGHATGLYNIGIGKSQLPLFSLRPDLLNIRQSWWLRDVCSASYFATVHGSGLASRYAAGNVYGVRPAFSIS